MNISPRNRLFLLGLTLVIGACSSGSKDSEPAKEKKNGMFSSEYQKPKTATAVEIAIEKEIAKDDINVARDRFKSAYGSNREDVLVPAAADILSKNPDDATVLKAMGLFYIKQGKPGTAKMYFNRVLEKDPKNADINNALGVIAMQEGKEVEAQRFFKLALQGNDDHVEANFNLGTYYLKYRDYEKAERFLESAYDKNSKNSDIASNYAVSLRGVGQLDKALDVYKGLDSKTTKVSSLLNQAILLVEYKKDFKEAEIILNKIKFITTDAVILRKVTELTKIVEQK